MTESTDVGEASSKAQESSVSDETMKVPDTSLLGRMIKHANEGSFRAITEKRREFLGKQYEILVELHNYEQNKEAAKIFPDVGTEYTDEQLIELENAINDPQRLADALSSKRVMWEEAYNQEPDSVERDEIALFIDAAADLESQFLQEAQRGK